MATLNSIPASERIHIGFFGLRNAGKSSVVNAVAAQTVSVVSDIKGTTTDSVRKAMELLPLGAVLLIDTPGTDDKGALGELRVKNALKTVGETDIAVLVVDAVRGITEADREIAEALKSKNIPIITVYNKADLLGEIPSDTSGAVYVSAVSGSGIDRLKSRLGEVWNDFTKDSAKEKPLVSDMVSRGDRVILVTPIDAAAPKGRIILPQQQVLRGLLDIGAVTVVVKETELAAALDAFGGKPKLVITDSQAFGIVNKTVPEDVLLTSFSILFARYKGNLDEAVRGAAALRGLKNGDKILMAEGCTHHRQCGDIGTVKLPAWINEYTGKNLMFEFSSGRDFPENLSEYALVVHCGACMLNEREMQSRTAAAKEQGVPITNYGTVIAETHGILKRSLSPFPDTAAMLDE